MVIGRNQTRVCAREQLRAFPEGGRGGSTIYRVLERYGALDGTHRQRRPAPPKGWYLPALAKGQAELDSFDFIED